MAKPEFINFDDPFLDLRYEGKRYVYNPEYGSLLDLETDQLVQDIPPEIRDFIDRFYRIQESILY